MDKDDIIRMTIVGGEKSEVFEGLFTFKDGTQVAVTEKRAVVAGTKQDITYLGACEMMAAIDDWSAMYGGEELNSNLTADLPVWIETTGREPSE